MERGLRPRVLARWLGPAFAAAMTACQSTGPSPTPPASIEPLMLASPPPTAAPAFGATSSWIETGSMLEPRQDHTATLLQDGRVLVAGGMQRFADGTQTTALASTELYDPETGRWETGPAMTVARTYHHAIGLQDGRVLVLGGWSNPLDYTTAIETGEVFDPATNAWSEVDGLRAGNYQAPLLLRDGRVLVKWQQRGSYSIPPARIEIFDPSTGNWTMVAQGKEIRGDPRLVLSDGAVLMIPSPTWDNGGKRRRGEPEPTQRLVLNNIAWRYNPTTDAWNAIPDAPLGFDVSHAVELRDGRVLLVGNGADNQTLVYGDPQYLWDPEDGPRYVPDLALSISLLDGRILFIGARDCIGGVLPAQLLGPEHFAIQLVSGLPNPYRSTITMLEDGRILAAGGGGPCIDDAYFPGQSAAAYLFDPAEIPPIVLD